MTRRALIIVALALATLADARPVRFGRPTSSPAGGGGGGGGPITVHATDNAACTGAATTCANPGLTTTVVGTLVACTLTTAGYNSAKSGVTVTGSSLGAFTVGPAASFGFNQWQGVYWHWASGTLSGEVMTAAWTGGDTAAISCIALSGARDPTSLTAGVDYATGTANGSSTAPTITLTTIGATGSWLIAAGTHWTGGAAITPDGTSTLVYEHNQGAGNPDKFTLRSTAAVSAGSNAIGGSFAASNAWGIAAMEVLVAP